MLHINNTYRPSFGKRPKKALEKTNNGGLQVHAGGVAQEAVGGDALFAARSLLAVPPVGRHPPRPATHPSREGPTTRIPRQAGYALYIPFRLHSLEIDLALISDQVLKYMIS